MFLRNQQDRGDVYIFNSKNKNRGLTSQEAHKRLEIYGENVLKEKKRKSAFSIFISQFEDFIILVLVGATIISWFMGEKADAITIAAIILLNGIMGFVQEYRTEKSLEALKQLTAPMVKVIRDGKITSISSRYIVPDDLILLEAGDRVPPMHFFWSLLTSRWMSPF